MMNSKGIVQFYVAYDVICESYLASIDQFMQDFFII